MSLADPTPESQPGARYAYSCACGKRGRPQRTYAQAAGQGTNHARSFPPFARLAHVISVDTVTEEAAPAAVRVYKLASRAVPERASAADECLRLAAAITNVRANLPITRPPNGATWDALEEIAEALDKLAKRIRYGAEGAAAFEPVYPVPSAAEARGLG